MLLNKFKVYHSSYQALSSFRNFLRKNMSSLIRISNAGINPKPYCFNYARHMSYKSDVFNTGSILPLSMSWSALRARMQKDTYQNGPFTSFSCVVKHPDEGVNIRKTHSKPIAKIMEDKQSQMNTPNNLVSLDPNASMWQHSFQAERSGPQEQKEDFCNNIQAFYRKRCEDGDKNPASKIDSRVNTTVADGISLYSQISKRNLMRQSMKRGVDALRGMNQQMQGSPMEEEEARNLVFPHDQKKKRTISIDSIQENVGPQLYKTLGQANKPPKDEPSNILKLAAERNLQYEKQLQAQKLSGNNKSRTRSQTTDKRGNSKNTRRADEEEPQEDLAKAEMVGYSVYGGANRKCPVYHSPLRKEEMEPSKTWHYKHAEETDSKTEKYQPKVISTQFVDSDDNDYIGAYSAASPPEPLFKPSTGIVTNKMKYLTDHLHAGCDFAKNIFL